MLSPTPLLLAVAAALLLAAAPETAAHDRVVTVESAADLAPFIRQESLRLTQHLVLVVYRDTPKCAPFLTGLQLEAFAARPSTKDFVLVAKMDPFVADLEPLVTADTLGSEHCVRVLYQTMGTMLNETAITVAVPSAHQRALPQPAPLYQLVDPLFKIDVGFMNVHSGPVYLYWVGPGGQESRVGTVNTLQPGSHSWEPHWQHTTIGDRMVARTPEGTVLGEYHLGFSGIQHIPKEMEKFCGRDGDQTSCTSYVKAAYKDVPLHEQPAHIQELQRLETFTEHDEERCPSGGPWKTFKDLNCLVRPGEEQYLQERTSVERFRVNSNNQQPTQVPWFTKPAFAKRSFVDRLAWQLIRSYYENNRDMGYAEQWQAAQSFVNHWEIPTRMIHLPFPMKDRIFNDLRPMLEDWAGLRPDQRPMEATALYGIRLYGNGSVLHSHVDRRDTHAISCIINVDQVDVQVPWALEIANHEPTFTNVTLVPGDIVFYESASAIHGRPLPCNGARFANIFGHFRPRDWQNELQKRARQLRENPDHQQEL